MCEQMPPCNDPTVTQLLDNAIEELYNIRLFVLDARPFPELDIYGFAAPIITSYLTVRPGFIESGYVYIARDFIYPIASWCYDLPCRLLKIPFLEYIEERDPDVMEILH